MVNPFDVIERRLSAIEQVLQELRQQKQSNSLLTQSVDVAPIISAKQVREMTNWSAGTFYLKVSQMPSDVVIRRSKKLLFDRDKFINWLKAPIKP